MLIFDLKIFANVQVGTMNLPQFVHLNTLKKLLHVPLLTNPCQKMDFNREKPQAGPGPFC